MIEATRRANLMTVGVAAASFALYGPAEHGFRGMFNVTFVSIAACSFPLQVYFKTWTGSVNGVPPTGGGGGGGR